MLKKVTDPESISKKKRLSLALNLNRYDAEEFMKLKESLERRVGRSLNKGHVLRHAVAVAIEQELGRA